MKRLAASNVWISVGLGPGYAGWRPGLALLLRQTPPDGNTPESHQRLPSAGLFRRDRRRRNGSPWAQPTRPPVQVPDTTGLQGCGPASGDLERVSGPQRQGPAPLAAARPGPARGPGIAGGLPFCRWPTARWSWLTRSRSSNWTWTAWTGGASGVETTAGRLPNRPIRGRHRGRPGQTGAAPDQDLQGIPRHIRAGLRTRP